MGTLIPELNAGALEDPDELKRKGPTAFRMVSSLSDFFILEYIQIAPAR
jgi:hypothetical protein